MSVHQRLREVCDQLGLAAKDLAAVVGVASVTARAWLRGTRTPSREMLGRIATRLGVSVDYLLGNEDLAATLTRLENEREAIYRELDKARKLEQRDREIELLHRVTEITEEIARIHRAIKKYPSTKLLPVLNRIVTGPLRYTEQEVLRWEAVLATVSGDYVVEVEDDNLAGVGVEVGDMAVIQQTFHNTKPGQLCAVLVGDEATLKYVVPKDLNNPNGFWLLRAGNPKYPDIEVPPENIRVVGVVTRILKQVPPCPAPPGEQA